MYQRDQPLSPTDDYKLHYPVNHLLGSHPQTSLQSRHNQSSLSYCFSLLSLNHRSYLINWVRWTQMRMDHAHLWNFRISDINEMLNWASNDVINQQQISYRSGDTFLKESKAQDGEKQMCWLISHSGGGHASKVKPYLGQKIWGLWEQLVHVWTDMLLCGGI